jgi:hypothetical protein
MDMGSQAAGMVGSAGNKAEKAYWLEFELEGKKIQGWVWKIFVIEMGLGVLFEKDTWHFMKLWFVVFFVMVGLIAFRISRMYMDSVFMAEAIFRTFGWQDVEKIDLRKTSRENPGQYKIPGFGEHYFRYKST